MKLKDRDSQEKLTNERLWEASISRREFLRQLASGGAAVAGAWLLSACGAQQETTPAPSQRLGHKLSGDMIR